MCSSIAIDPSSPRTGALLGDRVRMDSANSGEGFSLGHYRHVEIWGISASLMAMSKLLSCCGWEKIIIETVDPQSEIKK